MDTVKLKKTEDKIFVTRLDGVEVEVVEYCYTRGGSHSPTLFIWEYQGKRITPYERRLRGWKQTINQIFKSVYRPELIKDLIFQENPFLALVPKDTSWGGAYVKVPFEKP